MSLADLSGIPIVSGRLTVPFSGLWHADLVLAQAQDVSGLQTLNFAGVTWQCAYVRAIDFSGERGVRVVAGRGGWRTTIPAKQYGSGLIATATVMNDAALACNELAPVLDPGQPQTLGSAWDRQSGPASDVLQRILGSAWWADRNGVVQSSARSGTVSSPFQAMHVHGASGIYEIGSDSPNDWMPGVSFSGPTVSGVVSRVMHWIERDRLRTEVMVP
jgi:hypothetical protein